jgi:threonine synthase
MRLRCIDCGAEYPADMRYACTACGGILEVAHPTGVNVAGNLYLEASQWRYGALLPLEDPSYVVSLGEGLTPLHRAERLAASMAGFSGELWIKDETVNPSGSFKDRAISVAVSRARELGLTGIVCASSGNAGASAAAYAARAGMPALIVVPTHTPDEKLTQIGAYGAQLLKVDGHYSNAYRVGLRMAEEQALANVTTTYLNPYAIEGLKPVAHEMLEQMSGCVPDYVFIPTGSGPLVKGVVGGYRQCAPERGPKVVAVQAEGCAPIVAAFEDNRTDVEAWGTPTTFASGISDPLIGYERDGTYTLRLVKETGGLAVAVSDDEIRAAMMALARQEGILAEPTGASSIAAVTKLCRDGRIEAGSTVACLVTGHGFKAFKAYREMR